MLHDSVLYALAWALGVHGTNPVLPGWRLAVKHLVTEKSQLKRTYASYIQACCFQQIKLNLGTLDLYTYCTMLVCNHRQLLKKTFSGTVG